MRAHFRTISEVNGWDAAKLLKMTARNQELYRFDLADRKHFVIEDDLGTFLSDHPEAKTEQKLKIERGKITEYRVNMKVTFILKD